MVEFKLKNDTLIVVLCECMNHNECMRTLRTLDKRMTKNMGIRNVILDCSKVNDVTSTFVSFLISMYRRILMRNGNMAVYGMSERISSIVFMSGIKLNVTNTLDSVNRDLAVAY